MEVEKEAGSLNLVLESQVLPSFAFLVENLLSI